MWFPSLLCIKFVNGEDFFSTVAFIKTNVQRNYIPNYTYKSVKLEAFMIWNFNIYCFNYKLIHAVSRVDLL